MADVIQLQTPKVNAIGTFDPKDEKEIKFIYEDLQQQYNRLVIKNNTTGATVYDETLESQSNYYVLPSNTLTPGIAYIAQVQVSIQNSSGEVTHESLLSSPVLFYCYTTPEFNLTVSPIEIGKDLNVILNYEQSENDSLRTFQFILFDTTGGELKRSPLMYQNSSKKYSFMNLNDKTYYFVKAIGETTHGMSIETANYEVYISYDSIRMPANMDFVLTNDYNSGRISIYSNIKDVMYSIKNENYKFEDGHVKLWDNNEVVYDDGLHIGAKDNFVLQVNAREIPINTRFIQLNDSIYLEIIEISGVFYCHLGGIDPIQQYVMIPNQLSSTQIGQDNILVTNDGNIIKLVNSQYDSENFFVFEIKRVNGIYGLNIYIKEE